MRIFYKMFLLFIMVSLSFYALSMPKVTTKYQRTTAGFMQVKVTNSTLENLICYVAIDGHKVFFRLIPKATSNWYTATDIRYDHTQFSVWCDLKSLHPDD